MEHHAVSLRQMSFFCKVLIAKYDDDDDDDVYVGAVVDWCSTSYVYDESIEEQPLLCPHGYVCRLDTGGHNDNGIPNRGRCVRKLPEPLSGL